MGNKISLEDEMINLKLTSKQMTRASIKCEKAEATALAKVKEALKKGNHEGARIQAQNAIREKNQALNFLRLSSRIDAVASRLETAVRMKQVSKSMQGVVRGMHVALKQMDVEKIGAVMDQFEQQFEDMDVRAGYMENSMVSSTAMGTPTDQVDELIQKVADENGLELGAELDNAGTVGTAIPEKSAAMNSVEQDLSSRLADLRK